MAQPVLGMQPSHQMPKWWWWLFVAVLAVVLMGLPSYVGMSVQNQLATIWIYAMLALSMGFLWGFVGILSFGQTAFFGLGGYTYAVLGLNIGDTTIAMFLAVLLPMLFAAVLGYFMIYGRISEIYLSVITLVVTLIFEKGIRATSGDQFVIGNARLNGQNGMPNMPKILDRVAQSDGDKAFPNTPSLQVPWESGKELFITEMYYVTAVALLLIYIGLRMLLTLRFGRVLVSIRENERRSELLGYDSRRYKLLAFVIAAGIAGLAGGFYGGLFTTLVAPEMLNLGQAAEVIIWVIVGGKSTLIGPIVGTAGIEYLTSWLGTKSTWVPQVTLILGPILMIFVLLFQQGLLPSIGLVLGKLRDKLGMGRR